MTKRSFLKTIGALAARVPGLAWMPQSVSQAASGDDAKFTTVDCSPYFSASPDLFAAGPLAGAGLARMPAGRRKFLGVPFALGPAGAGQKALIVLSLGGAPGTAARVEIPARGQASFVCFAQFCDWDRAEMTPSTLNLMESPGQHLADAVLVFEDGSEQRQPIRRRFEVNSLSHPWGHSCFRALAHRQFAAARLTDPLANATGWGQLQLALKDEPGDGFLGSLWLFTLENQSPERNLRGIRFEAKSEALLAISGITLFHGREDPLHYDRLSLYRIALPEDQPRSQWTVEVDLGVVARVYQLPPFDAARWLASPAIGLGEVRQSVDPRFLYAEVSAARDATLSARHQASGARLDFDLARPAPGRIEMVEPTKTWLHAKVVDGSTGRPTPVRLAFRSKDGRYLPPYGHRSEVNGAWFQDYGADLRREDTSYAYVDGTFQIELPVGEVFLEMTKGFEYEPVRRKLTIAPGQRELNLRVERFADLRSQNWVSADSHVHFLAPSTAVLEAQGEGLNLINLLAAQWGDLFTNVGDIPHGPLISSDGDTMVWVGTENRQHMLGHVGLLGVSGEPVFPMSASGPDESYLGDPLWTTMADWTDACRERGGLAVAVHFPFPTAELAADIVLGKIDAVELYPVGMGEQFDNARFLEWYRYLNCGYRLPAMGGTDKMHASTTAGMLRGYVQLGQEPFNFPNWAKAVRRGNTFMTSGPLLSFQADGRSPGEEIHLGSGGGKLEIRAQAKSALPVHRLEIVVNGKVVATREDRNGARELTLQEAVAVSGPGWIAARCASRITFGRARVAAHTSPVYLVVPGQEPFDASMASYLLTLMDGSEAWMRKLAVRPDADRYARALAVVASARERLHQRMHNHGLH